MALDWENLFKRYVYDETRTPYFVATARMDQTQARNEIFFFSFLQTVLFGVLALASLSTVLPHGGSPAVTVICLMLCGASVLLGVTKHPSAALAAACAPFAAVAYGAVYGFHPALGSGDKYLIFGLAVLWALYVVRVVKIAMVIEASSTSP